ncbi:dephospho-CoA kinase [Chitinivorax sp. B]|uniref:dephospho-CoA kinase n=1 Tax=Chitinivorax sp. B TaxID=2502235 RepID=UPI0010F7C875|nr:dephospho-CoA kinase [Chitinivorax sp. B]
MTYVVALTGGIGSGKSTVAKLFCSLGAGLIDTDDIAHRLTQPNGQAIEPIRTTFGSHYIDQHGAMARDVMRHLIFADPSAKQRLEQILHPLIHEQVLMMLKQSQHAYTLLAVPLLVETGTYLKIANRVLVIDCGEAVQIARVMTRSGLNESEARAIMAKQAPRETRLAFADDVINNNGTAETLYPQVVALDKVYNELSSKIN